MKGESKMRKFLVEVIGVDDIVVSSFEIYALTEAEASERAGSKLYESDVEYEEFHVTEIK